MIEDDERWRAAAALFDPGAEVKFLTPGGGGIGGMAGPFRGIEGMRAGWREWLEPYDSFILRIEEIVDAGEGGALILSETTGKMQGAQTPLSQGAAAVLRADRGVITKMDYYLDHEQARRAAGL